MLHLVTGLPGHGKTLNTIERIEKLRIETGRKVFYHGIPELALDWELFDSPEQWYALPHNAIIVIDECQGTFPVRPPKNEAPQKCTEFETHRHKGWDIFLITQDPRLVDHHVRRLVGHHRHIERKFGVQAATVHEWERAATIDDYHDKQASNKTVWKYPKQVYKLYKSATQHTVKKSVPKWLYLLVVLVLFVGLLLYWFINTLWGDDRFEDRPHYEETSFLPTSPLPTSKKKELTFAQMMIPEVKGMPQSAPFYREVYKARSFPKPNCIMSGDRTRCDCYSQQVTKMRIDYRTCINIVENGLFDPTIEDPQRQQARRADMRAETKSAAFAQPAFIQSKN